MYISSDRVRWCLDAHLFKHLEYFSVYSAPGCIGMFLSLFSPSMDWYEDIQPEFSFPQAVGKVGFMELLDTRLKTVGLAG